MQKLLDIADKLLSEAGCPWDRKQTLESLQRYVLEEAHEVIEAIDEKDFSQIQEELGDLLYNIVFVSKLAEQKNKFKFKDVVENICSKLIRRHPHIFQERKQLSAEEVLKEWQKIKKKEKKQKHPLSGIPKNLPLLMQAQLAARRLEKDNAFLPENKRIKENLMQEDLTEEVLVDKLLALAFAAEKKGFSLEDGLRKKLKQLRNRLGKAAG